MLGIRFSKNPGCPRWKYLVFLVVDITTSLVKLVSMGYLHPRWSGDLLFSDWLRSDED